MSFEQITIIIALIMLLICFIVVIVMIYNSRGSKEFPARISRCPDFYTLHGDTCKPIVSGLPDVDALALNPSMNEICKYRKDHLKKHKLLMDGITNRSLDCFDVF